MRRLAFGASVGLTVLGLVLVGCGSSGNATDAEPSNSSDRAVLANKPADQSKSPVRIGFLGLKGNPIAPNPPESAAMAAEKYINDSRVGINGHPIKLVVCADEGTPESVTRCVTEFISQKVVAVVTQISTSEPQLVTPLQTAGIPLIDEGPTSAALGASNVIAPSLHTLETLLLPAVYGKQHGLNSTALVLVNSPGSQATIDFGKPFYARTGVTMSYQLVSATSADVTPSVQAAISSKPDSISFIGGTSTCVSGLKAKQTLGYTGTVFMSCAGDDVRQAAGSAVDGVVVLSNDTAQSQSAQDRATYEAAMKKYAPDQRPYSIFLPTTFADVVLTATVASQVPDGSLTKASLLIQFKSLHNFDYFLDGGKPLTCDGRQVGIAPAVCSSKGFVVKYQGSGLTSVGLIDFHDVFVEKPRR